MKRLAFFVAAFGLALLGAPPAGAQLNGSHTLGDFGVQSGTQAPPGFYAALFYYLYDTDTIKNADGHTISLPVDSQSSIAVSALAPTAIYVSKVKVLGANLGAMVVLPFVNASLEAPAFEIDRKLGLGVADVLLRPLDLGWHTKHADVVAGFQFYAPTGRYEQGADDNLGKGMWTYEPYLGATFFFDEKRTFSLATTAFFEFHGSKKDTDVKVGQILTLEGGLGKSFLGGGLVVGAAYYAQWKLTNDRLASFILPGGRPVDVESPGKHRVFAIGPDVTFPIAIKGTLYALINVRYLWETGARLKTQGQTLIVAASFPIPSIKLK